jgi:PadR family transcriptional regulator PadR
MQRNRPPSEQTMNVLLALAEKPAAWRHGYELCQQTGLKAGSMYPILMRLADRGLLETTWEREVSAGRPPRHLYRLTEAGADTAREFGEERRVKAAVRLRPRLGGA